MGTLLIELHRMIGIDIHKEELSPGVEVMCAPHVTSATLNWIVPPSMAETVFATVGRVMQRGTDIQNGIPHIPLGPAVLRVPVLVATSGSKSYFGPASVQAEGKPVAVALKWMINLNLNCGDAPSLTGVVFAANTVTAGLTRGDVLGAFLAMLSDALVQTVMNEVLGNTLGPWASGVAGMFIGSPLGFSFNAKGTGIIGLVGRLSGDLADLMRAFGEGLGGDTGQATEDVDAVGHNLVKEVPAILVPLPAQPLLWDVRSDAATLAKAAKKLAERALEPPLLMTGVDNPLVEEF